MAQRKVKKYAHVMTLEELEHNSMVQRERIRKDPGLVQKAIAGSKKKWQDPVYRAKMLKVLAKARAKNMKEAAARREAKKRARWLGKPEEP